MLRRFTFHSLVTIFALCLVSAPRPAFAADEVGKTGIASSLELLTPSADTYLQYNGRLVVQVNSTTIEEYRWGGTSCGSRTLSADNIRSLVATVNASGQITPRYQLGQGDVRCLVGFTAE